MKQIKPCPFCGSENLFVGWCYVTCNNCHTAGPFAANKEEAVNLWNAAPRKEDVEMEKNCANCAHISEEVDGKVYCCEKIDIDHSCKYWEALNIFGDSYHTCTKCKHSYIDDEFATHCGHEIGNPEGYVCDKWEAKASISTPLNTENSERVKTLCEEAISKWGEEAQISKAIEELSELVTALARWQNFCTNAKGPEILDNIREEREDVEIMLRQLDVIFGRSEEWQRKKYAHLQLIVGDTENE